MDQKGVTITQIVITIAIMLIILSVSVFYGGNVTKEANFAAVCNEIREVENALKEASALEGIEEEASRICFYSETFCDKVNNADYTDELGTGFAGNVYLLDFQSSSTLKHTLGLEKIKKNYLLDLEHLNIYLIDGIELPSDTENEILYNSDEIIKYYDEVYVK